MREDIEREWDRLSSRSDAVDVRDLEALWAALPVVAAAELRGLWRGFAFSTGHRLEKVLDRSQWFGKRFDALDDVKPLICRGEDGGLYSDVESGRGEASLWDVVFRGEVTATMVYDGMPVLDHFKRVDHDTLMGVMNGKPMVVLDGGQHFWFGLERR